MRIGVAVKQRLYVTDRSGSKCLKKILPPYTTEKWIAGLDLKTPIQSSSRLAIALFCIVLILMVTLLTAFVFLPPDKPRTKHPSFSMIQALIVSQVTLDNVERFANASHTRGLAISWYISAFNMREPLLSLIKQYKSLGDTIGLSLESVFFNQLEPSERIKHVDNSMDAFKTAFGTYPSIIEAYYIDSYTLNYISSKYYSVKGAIAYVNHEVYGDDFRSAGAYYMPYYPSPRNTLVPSIGKDKINIVVLPFAHRDITNNIKFESIRYNLSPQDGYEIITDWRTYFQKLFRAYIEGWKPFGMAMYLLDLTWPYIPLDVVDADLGFISSQIREGKCTNISDIGFVEWFRTNFEDSPHYQWTYGDPFGGFNSTWLFSPFGRVGIVNGQLFEVRIFARLPYEQCFERKISNYDNSMPIIWERRDFI